MKIARIKDHTNKLPLPIRKKERENHRIHINSSISAPFGYFMNQIISFSSSVSVKSSQKPSADNLFISYLVTANSFVKEKPNENSNNYHHLNTKSYDFAILTALIVTFYHKYSHCHYYLSQKCVFVFFVNASHIRLHSNTI